MRLKVVGNKLLTAADGRPVLLRGVNIPSLEFSNTGDHLLQALDVALDQWKANVIRLPLAQDRWYGRARGKEWEPPVTDGGAGYRALVDTVVKTAAKRRAYVILDLHWNCAGRKADSGGRPAQYRMADELSLEFWRDVAARYRNHPAVIFELFNEPYEISWDVWLNGGEISQEFEHRHYTFRAVGMQAMYDAVRATGAGNVVVVNGMEWGYDLSGVLEGYAVKGSNIIYGTHPYPHKSRDWDRYFGRIAEKYPVLIGEFGGGPEHVQDYGLKLLKYADERGLHWTAWALNPGVTPTLITGWDFSPSPFGELIKRALLENTAARTTGAQMKETSMNDDLPPSPAGKNWMLIWHDEFDGLELDPTKWDIPEYKRRAAWWSRRAVSLDGRGHLVISTFREGDEYYDGCVRTKGRFEHAFGYYVARIMLQSQPGHWSAFWLYNDCVNKVEGPSDTGGRDGTEIDIMEKPWLDERVQHTLHWDGYGPHHRSEGKVVKVPGIMQGWHTFGLLWTPKEYVFYVDGKETWRTSAGGVCQVPLYIKLSDEAELDGWAGRLAEARLPDRFLIDYVRVYDLVDEGKTADLAPER